MKANKLKALIPVFLSAVILAVIFFFSSQNGETSSGVSIKVTRLFARTIFFGYETMQPDAQNFIVSELHGFIRKLAHFTAYAFLGINIYAALKTILRKAAERIPAALLICAAFASLDEMHQLTVSGRAGSVSDVVIDTTGALAGIILGLIITSLIDYIKLRFNSKQD